MKSTKEKLLSYRDTAAYYRLQIKQAQTITDISRASIEDYQIAAVHCNDLDMTSAVNSRGKQFKFFRDWILLEYILNFLNVTNAAQICANNDLKCSSCFESLSSLEIASLQCFVKYWKISGCIGTVTLFVKLMSFLILVAGLKTMRFHQEFDPSSLHPLQYSLTTESRFREVRDGSVSCDLMLSFQNQFDFLRFFRYWRNGAVDWETHALPVSERWLILFALTLRVLFPSWHSSSVAEVHARLDNCRHKIRDSVQIGGTFTEGVWQLNLTKKLSSVSSNVPKYISVCLE
eukprot:IDg7938t1